MLSLFIILLGCSNYLILNDRVNTLNNYINSLKIEDITKITIFLSGGIKDPKESLISEASIMKNNLVNNKDFNKNNLIINFILDEKSENTAQNLLNVNKYLLKNNFTYNKYLLSTSTFHKNRVNKFIINLDFDINFEWILGDEKLSDSIYWENIHINNVNNDINKELFMNEL
jgi:uncharacterized SAM-binding protein YcdF (DUF218 family)